MPQDASDVAQRAKAIERIYVEFTQRLEVLRRKHNEEIQALLTELEQRKIAELRAQLGP